MVALNPPRCDFGWQAPAFALPATDGRLLDLQTVRGPKGLLVMFICNHCPYVQAILERIIRDCRELQAEGIGCVAISSNDPQDYPEDSFANMQRLAELHALSFSYLFDETQAVARAYGAVCTPDFFGFNAAGELHYRGRLDASGRMPAAPEASRELFEAMRQIARTGSGPVQQVPSIGCSIKWRA